MQIQHDALMGDHMWYRIGGKVKHLITASNRDDVLEALNFVEQENIKKLFVCGLGANLIFTDDYFDGVVLQITSGKNKLYDDVSLTADVSDEHIMKDGDKVTVFAGEILDNVLVYSLQNGLTGLEWAGGLPGTMGAGIRGNVGAFGGEIKDSIIEAEVAEIVDGKVTIMKLSNEELDFSYRTSKVKLDRSLIVLSGTFQLENSEEKLEKAKETYLANIAYRKNRHPLEKPNCGSVFKNINKKDEVEKVLSVWPDVRESVETKWHGKVAMGYINHRLGLSAKRVGNAQLSEKHGNFILNLGEAKATDVLAIIREIQEKVDTTFGFVPEVEVEIVE